MLGYFLIVSYLTASSNVRRKVDGLHGRENGDSKEQVLPDSKCKGRMSLAWDSAFFTSPGTSSIKFTFSPHFLCKPIVDLTTFIDRSTGTRGTIYDLEFKEL